jgi:hypothetical protein
MMARTIIDLEDELNKIWSLVGELSGMSYPLLTYPNQADLKPLRPIDLQPNSGRAAKGKVGKCDGPGRSLRFRISITSFQSRYFGW